ISADYVGRIFPKIRRGKYGVRVSELDPNGRDEPVLPDCRSLGGTSQGASLLAGRLREQGLRGDSGAEENATADGEATFIEIESGTVQHLGRDAGGRAAEAEHGARDMLQVEGEVLTTHARMRNLDDAVGSQNID